MAGGGMTGGGTGIGAAAVLGGMTGGGGSCMGAPYSAHTQVRQQITPAQLPIEHTTPTICGSWHNPVRGTHHNVHRSVHSCRDHCRSSSWLFC